MVTWGLLFLALLSASILTGFLLRLPQSQQWLDIPNDRSAHARPMPSSGGVAMVVPLLAVATLWYVLGQLSGTAWLLVLGSLPVAGLGLIDDLGQVRVRWRLGVQFLAAVWALWWLEGSPTFQLGSWLIDFPVLVHILAGLSFVWLLNLFNFMDGIDGLAASETVFVTLLSFLLVIKGGDEVTALLASLTFAVAAGFLVWNWPPARIFMGDVGSGLLAYLLGLLALWSITLGSINVWAWLLLLGVFVVDATYTLARRITSGQTWYQGHNTHAYQHAARRLASHRTVVLMVLGINLVWLAPLAWLANQDPQAGLWLTVLGWTPLILLVHLLKAGRPVADNRAPARAKLRAGNNRGR